MEWFLLVASACGNNHAGSRSSGFQIFFEQHEFQRVALCQFDGFFNIFQFFRIVFVVAIDEIACGRCFAIGRFVVRLDRFRE